MYYLADFSKLNEPEKEKRSPSRFITPTLAVAGGGLAGAGLTDYYNEKRVKNLLTKVRNISKRSNKIQEVSSAQRRKLSEKTRDKMWNKIRNNDIVSNKLINKAEQITKNIKRNNIIGGLGGAALGYGAYRGVKAGINKLRNKKEK